MFFRSNTKAKSNANYKLNVIMSETNRMIEQMQKGNFNIQGNTEYYHLDIVKTMKNINKMIDLMHNSVNSIITRFEIVNKTTKVGLWDMEVLEGNPVNPNNKFSWTDEFRHLLGYLNERDFPNILSSWSDKLHPDDLDWVLKAFFDHLTDYSSRTPYDVTYRLQLKNGEYRWFRALGITMRGERGIPLRVVGSLFDIHDNLLREEQIQELVSRFQLVNKVSKVGLWDMKVIVGDPVNLNNKFTWTDEFRYLLGYSNERDFPNILSSWSNNLHPDDLDWVLKAFFDHLNDYSGRTPYDVTYRLKLKSGEYRWFHALGTTIRGDKGIPLRVIGSLNDITNEKIKEQKSHNLIKLNEERYRALVAQSSEGIFIFDPVTFRIQETNNQFTNLLGYTKEELIKLDIKSFVTEDENVILADYDRVINHGETIHKIRNYRRKDGSTVEVEIGIALIHYNTTRVCLVNVRDLTWRNQSRKALEKSFEHIKQTLNETVNALVTVADKKDPYTSGHQTRVAKLAYVIAKEMGLSNAQIEGVFIAGKLHDLGKIYVPTDILNKPGTLSTCEMGIIKAHPEVSFEILEKIPFDYPVAKIAVQHHERWNGSGYPNGLSGEDILLEARTLAVADVVEAMSSHRPYRPAIGIEKAILEIENNSGILYDPTVVKACTKVLSDNELDLERVYSCVNMT
ncbi:MAG: PAS domain-containing protein [Desulfitobacteriaceae bacterium]